MTRGIVAEAARFLGVGVLSYGFGIGLAALFREVVGLRPEVSVALSLAVLVITNFWLARRWVFRSFGRVDRQFARFVLASTGMRSAEYGLFWLLHWLGVPHYLLSLTIAMGLSTCVKFIVYRALVFAGGTATTSGGSGTVGFGVTDSVRHS